MSKDGMDGTPPPSAGRQVFGRDTSIFVARPAIDARQGGLAVLLIQKVAREVLRPWADGASSLVVGGQSGGIGGCGVLFRRRDSKTN